MPGGSGVASFGLTDDSPVLTKEDRTKGLLSGFHEDGRPLDVPEARKLVEEMWEELNKAGKMCGMLNDQLQDVDRQKHDLLVREGKGKGGGGGGCNRCMCSCKCKSRSGSSRCRHRCRCSSRSGSSTDAAYW
jgi:hypothetical protein